MTDAEVKLLAKLSDKIGETGGKGWEILVGAARMSSLADMIQYVILGIVVFFYVKQAKKWISKLQSSEAGYDIIMFITGVLLAFLCLVSFIELHETLIGLINPEYWALKKLISACK